MKFSKFLEINNFVINNKYIYKHLIKKQLINNNLVLLVNLMFSIIDDIMIREEWVL